MNGVDKLAVTITAYYGNCITVLPYKNNMPHFLFSEFQTVSQICALTEQQQTSNSYNLHAVRSWKYMHLKVAFFFHAKSI